MTQRTVLILAATVVGLVLLMLVTQNNNDESIFAGGKLLPDFKVDANQVTNVSIARSNESENLGIRRNGGGWVVTERDDYPADIGTIRQLIIALADATIVEEKTANPDNYDRLGVADPGADGSGTKVVLTGEDFTYSVILGDAAQGNFRYARVTDNPTSYLIDQNPDLPTAVGEWLTDSLVDLPAARMRRVSISHADGETITIEKSEEAQTDFTVLGIPNGRELSYATAANGIGGALTSLTLQDARAAIEAAPSTSVLFETWDGLAVNADIATEGDSAWVTLSAAPADSAEESAAIDTEAETPQQSPAEEADEINSRVSGWQYQLAAHKKDLLVKRWDDILEPAEAE
ncbi:MAG: DUF4340 domain-containing protein [Woeseiaceae bacterium]